MQFVMTELVDPGALSSLPGLEETTPELAEAVLGEAAGHATEVLAPLNKSGDEQGGRLLVTQKSGAFRSTPKIEIQ